MMPDMVQEQDVASIKKKPNRPNRNPLDNKGVRRC